MTKKSPIRGAVYFSVSGVEVLDPEGDEPLGEIRSDDLNLPINHKVGYFNSGSDYGYTSDQLRAIADKIDEIAGEL